MTNYLNPSTRSGGVETIVVPERATVVPVDDAPFDDEQYVRVNGEWVPYLAPPIIPDTLAPKPPTGLGATGTMAANGTRVDYELEWDAPTQNTDNSPLTDFAYYVVRWRYASGGVYQMFTTKETSFLLPSLMPAVDVEWSVLARDYSGNDSTWADYTITGLEDSAAPNQPSLPQLATRLGSVIVGWDGLDFSAGAPPSDFEHLEAYMSATTGGPWEPIGRLGGAGILAVAGIPVGETRFFTFIAFDTSGNASTRSGESSVEVLGVEGPDLEANSVTANALAAGAVQATHLSAVLALVTKICSSETGRRWEADSFGIRVYESDGTILINFPTDPSTPSSFYGDLMASSLTVEDQLAIRGLVNEISKGAQLVLATGTTAPASAPVVTIDWEQIDTSLPEETEGLNHLRFGWLRWTGDGVSRWWTAFASGYLAVAIQPYSDAGDYLPFTSPIINTDLSTASGGLAVVGTNIYVLGKKYTSYTDFTWQVRGYNAAGAQIAAWQYVLASNSREPRLASDGTNLIIAYSTTVGNVLIWNYRNPLTGATVGSAVVSTLPVNKEMNVLWCGAADFGAVRVATVLDTEATVKTLTAAGVPTPNDDFPIPAAGVKGMDYYGGLFYTHDPSGHLLTKHTSTKWAAESSTWYASNTWYDGDATGGTHETAQSPRKSFAMKKRARLNLTTAVLPVRPIPNTTDDAKAARIYLGRGAADPGRTYMERMATLADGVRNWTSNAITLPAGLAVSPPPAASDFPASTPGKITSADGSTIIIEGSGAASKFGTLEVGLNGGTTLKNAIEISVGDVASTSQRLMRFFKKAASGANYYESREYLYNDGTVSGKVAGLMENDVLVANFIMRPNAQFDVQGVGVNVGKADLALQGVSIGRGTLPGGYDELTATSATTANSSTIVNIAELAATVNVLAGRRIRISVMAHVRSTVANDRALVYIREGSTTLGFSQGPTMTVATSAYGIHFSTIIEPSAGSHTYLVSMARLAGTGTLNFSGATTGPSYILVEDIGAAGT